MSACLLPSRPTARAVGAAPTQSEDDLDVSLFDVARSHVDEVDVFCLEEVERQSEIIQSHDLRFRVLVWSARQRSLGEHLEQRAEIDAVAQPALEVADLQFALRQLEVTPAKEGLKETETSI